MSDINTVSALFFKLKSNLDSLNQNFLADLLSQIPKMRNDKNYPLLMTEETRNSHAKENYKFKSSDGDISPTCPAEAFIWKQGDYDKYIKFLGYIRGEKPDGKSIVHKAFADHLREPNKIPIFDQHVCRSVWMLIYFEDPTISGKLDPVLFNSNGKWRDAPKTHAVPNEFYDFFKVFTPEPFYYQLDTLLMKLGRITKQLTKREGQESRILFNKFLESTVKIRYRHAS